MPITRGSASSNVYFRKASVEYRGCPKSLEFEKRFDAYISPITTW